MSVGQCRYCLACLAFFYPFSLLAGFLLDAAPALVRSALSGQKIERLAISPRGVAASATAALTPQRRGAGGRSIASNATIALSLAALLWLVPANVRPFAGYFVAIVGAFGRYVFFHGPGPLRFSWTDAILLLPLLAGLWFHLRSVAGPWWKRTAATLIVFAIPCALIRLLTFRTDTGRIPWQMLSVTLGPAVAAALLGILLTGKRQVPLHLPSWKPSVAGALVSLAALLGLAFAERAQASAAREAAAARLAKAEAAGSVNRGTHFFQKGVNFTSEGWARYGAETSLRTLRAVHARGVDSIALVPYGFARADVPFVRYGNPGGEPDDGIGILTAEAHRLGMKVMLKPQLWVQPGGFPGAIQMPDAGAVREWFAQYIGMAEYYARLAERFHVDIYCVGTELVHMSRHADEWRGIVARARELYKGPIVYAATQGPEFENLAFWDVLDYIGLNNYYPLPDDFSTIELVKKVEAVQAKYGKPVLLTEAGYVSMEWPNRAPWDETPRALSMEHQARCYEALFQAFWDKPWFAGVYWWRVGSNGEGGPEDGHHTPWGKPAMDVVSRYYATEPAFSASR